MIVPAHLNFFEITVCGLYKRGVHTPIALDAEETFDLIYKWVQGKPMEDTIPWDQANVRAGVPACYCHDFYKCENTGDYLFVLWKASGNSAGTIWGAQANAPTGKSTVVEYTDSYQGGKVIWGNPCYYWIIPELNTVASIKMEHSVCDAQMFQDWVTKCITNRIQHANKKKTATVTGQVRFEFTDDTDISGSKYSFGFDVRLKTSNTSTAELQELAARVTHIVRRDTIKLNAGLDERGWWIKLFDGIPLLPSKPNAKVRQIEIRAEAKPSASEIRGIIEKFSKEERKSTDWNNVGFDTDAGIVWADKYRLHASMKFSKEAGAVLPAADVHARLMEQREKLLSEIRREEKINNAGPLTAAGG